MSKIPCYSVGRSAPADMLLQHASVSRVHAEVVPLSDGRVYVTDRDSTNGTFIRERGRWRRITQDFAGAGDEMRFGDMRVSVRSLRAGIAELQGADQPGQGHGGARLDGRKDGKRDRRGWERSAEELDASRGVARNPETGEPVALAGTSAGAEER